MRLAFIPSWRIFNIAPHWEELSRWRRTQGEISPVLIAHPARNRFNLFSFCSFLVNKTLYSVSRPSTRLAHHQSEVSDGSVVVGLVREVSLIAARKVGAIEAVRVVVIAIGVELLAALLVAARNTT